MSRKHPNPSPPPGVRRPPPPPAPPAEKPATSPASTHQLTADELRALDQTLEFLRDQEGKSHGGYFWSGWAGQTLTALLKRSSVGTSGERNGYTVNRLMDLLDRVYVIAIGAESSTVRCARIAQLSGGFARAPGSSEKPKVEPATDKWDPNDDPLYPWK